MIENEIQKLNQKYSQNYIEFLGFNHEGISAVKDSTGAYHITQDGKELYSKRFNKTFGFYCSFSTVVEDYFFHIDKSAQKIHSKEFLWAGNFVQNRCTVKLLNSNYKHIDLFGNYFYEDEYFYVGDYNEDIAVVTFPDFTSNHIDFTGKLIHKHNFLDLGVYHKGFAIAKDEFGYFHINLMGKEIYKHRFSILEPFYNGIAFAHDFKNEKCFVDTNGNIYKKR